MTAINEVIAWCTTSRSALLGFRSLADNGGVTIRNVLLRLPVIGPIIERRWMTDPVERDTHQELVLARLAAPARVDPTAEPVDSPEAEPPLP